MYGRAWFSAFKEDGAGEFQIILFTKSAWRTTSTPNSQLEQMFSLVEKGRVYYLMRMEQEKKVRFKVPEIRKGSFPKSGTIFEVRGYLGRIMNGVYERLGRFLKSLI